jgi:hypothetical protein
MRRRRAYVFSDPCDSLERRWSLSGIASSLAAPPAILSALDDPLPPPDPEPDPGPFPGDDPPIAYPPLPPSGPVGPGFSAPKRSAS